MAISFFAHPLRRRRRRRASFAEVFPKAALAHDLDANVIKILELSTHAPTCNTGGMPTASQISRSPGPAYSNAASGRNSPHLASAIAEHPDVTTKHIVLQQFFGQLDVSPVM
jgi:hypothetical protein